MDKIGKIGLAISILLLIGWFYWTNKQSQEKTYPIEKKRQEEYERGTEKEIEDSVPGTRSTTEIIEKKTIKSTEIVTLVPFPEHIETVVIETKFSSVELNPFEGVIQKVILKENNKAGIRKLPEEKNGEVTLFSLDDVRQAPGVILKPELEPMMMKTNRLILESKSGSGVEFSCSYSGNISVKKSYIFDQDSYKAYLRILIKNNSTEEISFGEGIIIGCGAIYPIDENDLLGVDVLTKDRKIIRVKGEKPKTEMDINWLGLKTKYFTSIFQNKGRLASFYSVEGKRKEKQISTALIGCARGGIASPFEYLKASMGFDPLRLKPGEEAEYSFELYLGPADYETLKKAGNDFDKILDLGMMGKVYIPQAIIWLMNKIYSLIGSYGWAILFLTVIIKIILWPLTHKSYKSMKEMQNLQPQIAKLREIYKGNAKKLQAETMKLYKKHGVNPMGGCLPMIFQMPILFALFTTLRNTIMLRKAPFWIIPNKWIMDLSGPDALITFDQPVDLMIFKVNQFNLLPILMGVTFYIQQKFTPTSGAATEQAAQQQKMMGTMMPILFMVMFYTLPSGLNLYFMISTLITVGQQLTVKTNKI